MTEGEGSQTERRPPGPSTALVLVAGLTLPSVNMTSQTLQS